MQRHADSVLILKLKCKSTQTEMEQIDNVSNNFKEAAGLNNLKKKLRKRKNALTAMERRNNG